MQENNGNSNNQKQGGLSWSTPPSNQVPAQKPVMPPKAPAAPKAAQSSSSSAKYVGMIVVGVVAGVILAWGWMAFRSPAAETATNEGQTATGGTDSGIDTTSVPALGSDPSLNVSSPQSAGLSVAIAKAIVSVPTWVVVYENKDGAPGNALGAALFFPEKQAGTVELLRGTTAGKSYLVVKQVDNGDRKFSLRDDQLLAEDGEVQWVTFEVR